MLMDRDWDSLVKQCDELSAKRKPGRGNSWGVVGLRLGGRVVVRWLKRGRRVGNGSWAHSSRL